MQSEYHGMLKKYEDNLVASSPHTQHQLIQIITRFLEYASGEELDRPTVMRYLKKLQNDKYADGTIALHYRTIATFFKVNKIEVLAKKDAPLIREGEVKHTSLDPELVGDMILLGTQLTTQEAGFLVLSTTYGLRRTEMLNITADSFAFKDNLVFIESLKGSRQRYHLIPDAIKVVLTSYDFNERLTPYLVNKLFWSIGDKTNMDFRGTEANWHAIRRTLDTLLLERLPHPVVKDFLRWKASSSDMPSRYYSARSYLGRSGTRIEMAQGEKKQDERVFEVHPFLPIWEKVNAQKTKGSQKTNKR